MLKSALLAKFNQENKKAKKPDPPKLSSASPIVKASAKKFKKAKVGKPIAVSARDEILEKLNTETRKIKKNKSVSKKLTSQKVTFDKEILDLATTLRIDPGTVERALQGLIKFVAENPKLKNKLFDDEQYPILLQINSIKVPPGHSQIVRIPIKHSLLTEHSEICLIVPDVKGVPNKNHEQHLDHYEKLLRQKGVTNINKIMTFHEFRTEYETFEVRNRLVELYDMFLVDGRVSGKTVRKCGKIFYKKRKVPTAIKLQATKLREHIDQTLKKTPLYLHGKGDSFVVQIGHSKMGVQELVENLFYIVRGLEKSFPGGFENIRSLSVFTHKGIRIPIYTTLRNKNQVDLTKNVQPDKVEEPVLGELSTKLNSGVSVKTSGAVEVFKLSRAYLKDE